MATSTKGRSDDEGTVIFTTHIRLRNGKVLYARDCGLKAFRIVIKPKK